MLILGIRMNEHFHTQLFTSVVNQEDTIYKSHHIYTLRMYARIYHSTHHIQSHITQMNMKTHTNAHTYRLIHIRRIHTQTHHQRIRT